MLRFSQYDTSKFSIWLGGAFLLLALAIVINSHSVISETTFFILLLSTLATSHGTAVHRIRSSEHRTDSDAHSALHFSSVAAALFCVALLSPIPISYFIWTIEFLLFIISSILLIRKR